MSDPLPEKAKSEGLGEGSECPEVYRKTYVSDPCTMDHWTLQTRTSLSDLATAEHHPPLRQTAEFSYNAHKTHTMIRHTYRLQLPPLIQSSQQFLSLEYSIALNLI